MKIYNKKGFVFGIGAFLLSAILISSFFYTSFRTFDIKSGVLLALLLFFGIADISRSLSKEQTRKDMIDQKDERNQFVSMKSKAKALDILTYTLFTFVAACMIGFGLSKEIAFMWLFLGSAIPLGILEISVIVLALYYEKHE